ncbi:hypothetical protein RMATCC62417_01554 [Rhizopus microsporus]|nr:hypothetical protein RMATCC62417_01554 [Rhizopus microsporus]
MFQHGASDKEKIETYMYPPEYEDFAGEASRLDIWVFDHVKELFKNASTNPELDNMLRQKKIVFFLHLLGLDTNGHGFRPSSKEYLENIKLVDSGIKEIVNLIEGFYQDRKTSYIFTADHGMNNRGAHGDGHPDNTRTPIVAWGAGIRQPIHSGLGHDEYSSKWGLSALQRDDILQADIAPLMAHLIGIDIPVNSVGELPLSYLNANGSTKAEAAFTNARQILEQLRVKHNEKEQHELFFRPYPGLVGQHDPTLLTSEIKMLITDKDYELAEKKSKELIELCLRGLRYYQTYDWLFLRTIITIGYVGWCIFCLEFVIRHFVLFSNEEMSSYLKYRIVIDFMSIITMAAVSAMIYLQKMPKMYYLYVFFPIFFWNQVLRYYRSLIGALRLCLRSGITKLLMIAIGSLLFLEALVGSYFHREVLSAIFIGLSAWPCVMPSYVRQEKGKLTTAWSLFCILTSVFTLLPVEKGESIEQVIAGGVVAIIMGTWLLWKLNKLNRVTKKQKIIIYIQLCMIAGSMAIVYSTSISLKNRAGLPELNQIASWCIIAISSVFPFVYRGSSHDDYLARLLVICLAFTPLMTLLSISYELLFYVFFCSTVLLWMEIERSLYKHSRYSVVRALKPSDGRAAILFMFFVNVAFFGTGNVASLSSFSLESVYRFTTVFNPFLMGALLILKILIPFFVISSVLGIISSSLDLQPFTLFLIVMSITDIQTINFFYFVTDYGSWLEIGTSISHFCISELFIIFTIILFLLSRILVGHLALPKLKRIVDRMKPKSK